MGKRSDFERVPKDYYRTPKEPIIPLARFLPQEFDYVEPCAGDRQLIKYLSEIVPGANCTDAFDIEPDHDDVIQRDATTLTRADMSVKPDFVITNPPWSRDKKSGYLLHRLIDTFVKIAPTWLLFDADWMHTVQAQSYMSNYCSKIVSVGRVKWIEGSKMTGKDNCAWYLFSQDARQLSPVPVVYGRGIFPPAIGT